MAATMQTTSLKASSFLGNQAEVSSRGKVSASFAPKGKKSSSCSSGSVAMFNCPCEIHSGRKGKASHVCNALPAETINKILITTTKKGKNDAWKAGILGANKAWADSLKAKDPDYFTNLAKGQSPEILWIGCADSRMPANNLLGKLPGEVFVHRNIANVVPHTDVNALSVMEYSINVLKVKHVIVCGHYNCGGVLAASQDGAVGLVDNWLRHIREVRNKHIDHLNSLPKDKQFDRLVQLNVLEQVKNVASSTIVQQAWARGQPLSIHGWVYDLRDGLLKELGVLVESNQELPDAYRLD